MCWHCTRATAYEICWGCGSDLEQWRVFLYCRNIKCSKYSLMISLHDVTLQDRFSDFWKQKKGVRVGKKKD